MPHDFTHDDGKRISFKGDSKFAMWLAAQDARTDILPDFGGERKRAPSQFDISMYTATDCGGDGHFYYSVIWEQLYYDNISNWENHSIRIRRNPIDPNKARILLKTWDGGQKTTCTDLNFYVYGPVGCASDLPTFTCFKLAAETVAVGHTFFVFTDRVAGDFVFSAARELTDRNIGRASPGRPAEPRACPILFGSVAAGMLWNTVACDHSFDTGLHYHKEQFLKIGDGDIPHEFPDAIYKRLKILRNKGRYHEPPSPLDGKIQHPHLGKHSRMANGWRSNGLVKFPGAASIAKAGQCSNAEPRIWDVLRLLRALMVLSLQSEF
ncbi:hypothetical protein K440DRAFT_663709 [Wilcoxina mikolae CBS 423.85]|nr:hypothetical protein K440DRAFT_663709 [Wilcoxina mikolae CBS 423.85]